MIEFNPFDLKYKSPFGAVPCGTEVRFSIFSDSASEIFLLTDSLGSFSMKKEGDYFKISITPTEAGLLYYAFKIIENNSVCYCCNSENGAEISDDHDNYFQLTVYEQTPALPEWYTKGIVYQIFPDRFFVGGTVNKAKENAYYRKWNESPDYIRDETQAVSKWDFYGGNLKGITEKLPYLKSLGVTAIYLNPIFESSSNHRYSTADFKKIDNILGTLDDFKELVSKAKEAGIHLILDGVFNHVGADSIYFNKFRNYGDGGAYNDPNSPYFSWFKFENYPDKYECWWGVYDLPNLDESDKSLLNYLICDDDSVIKYWTDLGIGGWRLDVADELPDEFLALLYKTVKSHNKDAIIMGEVWEDASNKVAYNTLKKYFTNRELDCVMNYPFRDNLLAFFSGEIDANALKRRFMVQLENYPKSAFYANLNLLGTHDVERIFTKAEEILPENPTALMNQLVSMQFAFPGVPCIYYGDEAGVTGGKDPDNRKPYPWGNENREIFEIFEKNSKKRTTSELLKAGETLFLAKGEDVFGVKRFINDKSYTLWVNRSDKEAFGIPSHGTKEEMQNG